jgi:5-methylcytosine-specific restriction endonuclease McrA
MQAPMNKKYTKELLAPIIANATNWADACRSLNIKPSSGSQTHLAKVTRGFGLVTNHFSGQGWNKGKKFPPRKSILELLNSNSTNSDRLRSRLFREKLKERRCEQCKESERQGHEIPLELHHLDCNHSNNHLDNLQILCANCHSIAHLKIRSAAVLKQVANRPLEGRAKLSSVGVRFSPAAPKTRKTKVPKIRKAKISWPSDEELHDLVWSTATTKVAAMLGVSDKAVEKRLRKLHLSKPPRGYWALIATGKTKVEALAELGT